jgi:NAD(P)-dependent dehydrogenase (short-subunit alcohol dehydrogenase family)
MDLSLRGKRALVTGSTAGIGFAIAQRLVREGAHVVVSGRTSARVEHALEALRRDTPAASVVGVAADLSREEGVKDLIERAGDLEILVNNVGVYQARPPEDLDAQDYRQIFETNVISGVLLSNHHLHRMLVQNEGRIIFISSESALQIPVEMIHYGVAKAAQVALARGLAERTRGTRVTVNSVLAGPTRSEGVKQFIDTLSKQRGLPPEVIERDFFERMRPTSLLQRFLDPAEVANVVAFVASPVASAINGAAVRAEGGVLLSAF